MYREIQQLVPSGVESLLVQHVIADFLRARERAGVLEAHHFEQVGVLVAVFLAADNAPREKFQMRDETVVFDGRAVRLGAVGLAHDACIR